MSIRLIASDMDGTLLDPYSNVSAANIEAIKRLSPAGVEFLICSGREYADAKSIMEDCGIQCSYICLSGAAVYDQAGRSLTEIPLSPKNLEDVTRILTENQAEIDLLTSNGRYSTSPREKKLERFYSFFNGGREFDGPIPEEIKKAAENRLAPITFFSDVRDLPESIRVFKICSNDNPPEKVVRLKELFSACPDLAAASSFPTNIELTNVRAQKGNALKAYAALKGISLKDVMVLGDSDNDLSMFAPEFGWTVAMENSMPCIRSAAKYHTRSNSQDGVAWAIRRYVFGESL